MRYLLDSDYIIDFLKGKGEIVQRLTELLDEGIESRIMIVSYDEDLDIAYIRFSHKKPDGAIEIGEGVVLDTTARNEIVGIEIFDAKEKLPLKSLYQFEVSPAHRATKVRSRLSLHPVSQPA